MVSLEWHITLYFQLDSCVTKATSSLSSETQSQSSDYKPHKKEKERVPLTFGGDRLDYAGDVATLTAYITTFKILINSTLSTKDAVMMMMDIKNYYLGTPLPRFEYMKMQL
jgi:hypothetical protein